MSLTSGCLDAEEDSFRFLFSVSFNDRIRFLTVSDCLLVNVDVIVCISESSGSTSLSAKKI